MLFKQIKHISDNFSYIIADETSREAIVVDPSYNAEVIIQKGRELGMHVKYIINTHSHRDHIAGNQRIKSKYNAKIVAHKVANLNKDVEVVDNATLTMGNIMIQIIHTPGHTPDSICLLVDDKLLTGDTLFIGECGRTDLPGGNSKEMYNSLFHKLMKLPDVIEVYPGHDYGSKPYSTIGEEKRSNYTLEKRSLKEFIEFMMTP